ncbi:MAG: nucleotidyltransferase family protein [Pseudonocardiaceae bacterium]
MARTLCSEDYYPLPLLAVAGYALPEASRVFPQEPLGDESWASVLSAAHTHRVTGLLCAAIDGGALPATEAQVRQARAAHRSRTLRVLSLERELIAVVDLLAASAIETRVLKGTAVAHLDYSQPSIRSFIDLDILVRPADIDRAVQVLGAAGFIRTLAEPRPGFDRRFDKGMTLVSPARYELDLHRTFVLGPWGVAVDLDALWDCGQEFTVAGRSLRALSRANRFMHACYHAALGDWPLRLASLRDVAEMLRGADQDGEALIRLASDWGVGAVVAAAVADARRLLGIVTTDELSSWAERYVPSRREAARLALHTHPDKTFAAQALATLRVIPRLRDKAAYLRALLLPDLQYTAGRHSSALARFNFGIQEARRGRGPRG